MRTNATIAEAGPAPFGIAQVIERVSQAAFGQPLVTNVLRGHVAEAIIAAALEPEWRLCSADYSSWDFERADGMRLEVKQSATRQSWAAGPNGRASASFDIAPRTGWWDGAVWKEQPGRAAHVYVFAHHDVDEDHADHRDPSQWTFYVVPAVELPSTKRIGIGNVRRITNGCGFSSLAHEVTQACAAAQV